jgi:hypothetical protein
MAMAAIDVGAGIGRILQDLQHACVVRRPPDHLVRPWPVERADRQRQAMPLQFPHHRLGALQRLKGAEHQPEAGLHLLVRVEHDLATGPKGEPGRLRQAEGAARGFLTFALVQAQTDLMQFRLAHDARQPQQQAVMISAWIIQALTIGDDHAKDGA